MTLLSYTHFGPVHCVADNFITNCCIWKYRLSVLLLSRYPLSTIDVGVVPLDNLCQADINLPRIKCNSKQQSSEGQSFE